MIRTTTAILAALALGACATEIGSHDDAIFGDAVRQNIAAQTVNPEGSSADVVTSGARVDKAVRAHASDTVEKPGASSTTSVGSSGAAGQAQ
jgi:hypothetical protein